MKTDNGYAYNARHGEYVPDDKLIAEWFYGGSDDEPVLPVPAWVTPELIDEGFGDGPCYEQYIRFECDEAGLLARVRSLYELMAGGPFGGDDDSFDYWPSGALLFEAMAADVADPERQRACAEMRQSLIDGMKARYDEGEEVHDRVMEIFA